MKTQPRTFQRPYRTWVMSLYNRVGRQLRRWGWRDRLSLDNILESAVRRAKVSDWGDDRFHEPLRVLLDSLEEDAQLSPLGRLLVRYNLVHRAANRLRAVHAIKTQPDLVKQAVHRPLFIVGLPRTGTTLLHNLLAQRTGARPLLFWESSQPAVNPGVSEVKDRRRAHTRALVYLTNKWSAPDLQMVHPLQADAPEECTAILCNTFVCSAFFLLGFVRGYMDWLRERGRQFLPWVYEEHCRDLQILQSGRPGESWVLKSPAHLLGLGELLKQYPDACVVLAHREMDKVLPSACSLFAITQGLFSDAIDCRRLGPEFVQRFGRAAYESVSKARADNPGRIFDVHYRSLIADPLQTVRDIHDYFGFDVDEAMEQRMRQWLADNPANKHGVHHYDLEQFGLTRADVERLAGDYADQLAIPSEHLFAGVK